MEPLLHDGEVISLAFSPDSCYVAGGSAGVEESGDGLFCGRVKIWECETQKLIGTIDLPQQVTSMAFAPDARLLIVACGTVIGSNEQQGTSKKARYGEVCVFSFPSLKEEKRIRVGDVVRQIQFSRDGRFLAASYCSAIGPSQWDGGLLLWSVSDWKKIKALELPGEWRVPISKASTDSFLYAAKMPSGDGFYQTGLFSAGGANLGSTTPLKFRSSVTPSLIEAIACYSRDARMVCSAGGPLYLIDVASGTEITPERLTEATSPICTAFAISSDGKHLACLVKRVNIKTSRGVPWIIFWDLVNNKESVSWSWDEVPARLSSVAISPNSKTLAIGTAKPHLTNGRQRRGEIVLYDISKCLK